MHLPFTVPLNNVVYLRFHGIEKGYRGSYHDKLLLQYAKRMRQWMRERKCVYCYFNNTLGNAFGKLWALKRLVEMKQHN